MSETKLNFHLTALQIFCIKCVDLIQIFWRQIKKFIRGKLTILWNKIDKFFVTKPTISQDRVNSFFGQN